MCGIGLGIPSKVVHNNKYIFVATRISAVSNNKLKRGHCRVGLEWSPHMNRGGLLFYTAADSSNELLNAPLHIRPVEVLPLVPSQGLCQYQGDPLPLAAP